MSGDSPVNSGASTLACYPTMSHTGQSPTVPYNQHTASHDLDGNKPATQEVHSAAGLVTSPVAGSKQHHLIEAAAATPAPAQVTAATPLEPLACPDASEGPDAAAEYRVYKDRWAAGDTLAQRWARLEASGKAAAIREEWEDMQLDMMLQQHCSNTAAAKAARAAAAAGVNSGSGAAAAALMNIGGKSRRRPRAELGEDAGTAWQAGGLDEGMPAGRRTRTRHAPKMFRDFELDIPQNAQGGGVRSSDSDRTASPEPSSPSAATTDGVPQPTQQQQVSDDVPSPQHGRRSGGSLLGVSEDSKVPSERPHVQTPRPEQHMCSMRGSGALVQQLQQLSQWQVLQAPTAVVPALAVHRQLPSAAGVFGMAAIGPSALPAQRQAATAPKGGNMYRPAAPAAAAAVPQPHAAVPPRSRQADAANPEMVTEALLLMTQLAPAFNNSPEDLKQFLDVASSMNVADFVTFMRRILGNAVAVQKQQQQQQLQGHRQLQQQC